MQPKDAVTKAKVYLTDLFAAEEISNLGLEEIEFDETRAIWSVTIGFSRPWNRGFGTSWKRDYKVVRISDLDGSVRSVKNREVSVPQ